MGKNKIRRNERCWCGSGRKYKHCHLGRDTEPALPFGAISSEMWKAGRVRTCLHPDASSQSCGTVISAHTLQRARVLRTIADQGNHVLTFYPYERDDDGRLKLHKRGWNQASTFTAFCSRHDGSTFGPLELNPFRATKEQIFLIAYRAICWEFHQKTETIRAMTKARDLVDRGQPKPVQMRVQRDLRLYLAALQKGLSDLTRAKVQMDAALRSSDYSSFVAYEVELQGQLSIAATGAVTPDRSLNGATLQVLENPNTNIQWFAFGVDIKESGASAVFLWPKGDEVPRKYIDEIDALSDQQLGEFLVQFFFGHCENTYFSSSWWDSLNPEERRHIERLASNSNPYDEPPEYDLSRSTAPWRVVARNYL